MNRNDLAKLSLIKIVQENIDFPSALKIIFKNNDVTLEDKTIVTQVVGCVLRHYLIANKIILDQYPSLSSDGIIALMIALNNALFLKKLDQEQCSADANRFLENESLKAEQFISQYEQDHKLVPENIVVGSPQFLSYRYNTPLSVVKMWNKQFGGINTLKILKAHSRQCAEVVRINNRLIDDDTFFTSYPEFEKHHELKGVALNKGDIRFKKSEVKEKKLAFTLPIVYKEIFDEVDLDLLRGLAIYSEYTNEVFTELISRKEDVKNIEFIANNINVCNSAKSFLIRNKKIKGVNIYEAQASSIITCLSKPVHTFLLMPHSSRLALLQLLPDYFLRFDVGQLDEIIANQKNVLNEAASHVEADGYLIYLIDTISKKESVAVINSFLNDHQDFVLYKDKQLFPFRKFGCSYYYAILKKVNNDD